MNDPVLSVKLAFFPPTGETFTNCVIREERIAVEKAYLLKDNGKSSIFFRLSREGTTRVNKRH
jgi:hypothetical protein